MSFEVNYIDQDGNECVFIDVRSWLLNDVKALAREIAREDMDDIGDYFFSPEEWPRWYDIQVKDKWVRVSVDMEYIPTFHSKIIEGKKKGSET